MGKKGPTRHLKRHKSPAFWPLHKKEKVWATKTSPGPHNFSSSIPINVILRDFLKHASTNREAKMIVKQGKVKVDGKVRFNERYPAGLMDVIAIPDARETFRILPEKGGRYKLHSIKGEENNFKLCKIVGKYTLKDNLTQLRLHDGKNIQVSNDNAYKVNDILKIKLPELEILEHIKFKDMLPTIITGGRSQGETGTIIGLGDEPGWKKTATIRTPRGDDIRTLLKYVFPLGESESLISLPES
ncbi:30S ribosomal protein S4e [Candidatus Bathyarchaeota archaeon]|nr:30S ribosomal protein S4e [Candidatus Bathyarchaeota archaeon]